jgi:hypothetical protein
MLGPRFPFATVLVCLVFVQLGFRGEYFLEINQSEIKIACGGHVYERIETKLAIFIEDLP